MIHEEDDWIIIEEPEELSMEIPASQDIDVIDISFENDGRKENSEGNEVNIVLGVIVILLCGFVVFICIDQWKIPISTRNERKPRDDGFMNNCDVSSVPMNESSLY